MRPAWTWRRAALLAAFFLLPAHAQQTCMTCHGPGGNSVTRGVPSIAAQPSLFIETQLVLIREELRPSPQMLPIVKGMNDAEITRLAQYFSKLPAKSMESGKADPKLVKIGAARAKALRCDVCHVSDFSGQKQVPRLAGQRSEYLASEMRAYRDGKRQGGDTIMAAALYGVSDADIDALAHFLSRFAARTPGRRRRERRSSPRRVRTRPTPACRAGQPDAGDGRRIGGRVHSPRAIPCEF